MYLDNDTEAVGRNHQEVLRKKKKMLKIFAKFTEKQLRQSLFFNKAAGMRPEACNFIKKRLWRRCFPVNFAKFIRTPFLQNTSGGCF